MQKLLYGFILCENKDIMKITNVHIENYRSIKNVDIKIHDIIALIGENNAGKSNIMSAINLFFSDQSPQLDDFYTKNDNLEIKIEIKFQKFNNNEATSLSEYIKNDTAIFQKRFYYKDGKSKSEITSQYYKDSSSIIKAAEWKHILHENLPDVIYIPAVLDATKESENTSTTLFGKIFSKYLEENKEINQSFNDILSGETFKNMIDKITTDFNNNIKQYIDANINISPLGDIKNALSKSIGINLNDGIETDIKYKGNGLQRIVIFALFNLYYDVVPKNGNSRSFIFLIEEPEIYMHPQMQRSMLKQFKKTSSEFQIIFSTHSSNFIDIFDYQDIIIVRKNQNSSYINQIQQKIFDKDEKEDFNKLLKFDNSVNDLFFAKKVILVEGPTDSIVLKLFSEYCNIDLDALDISITICGGKGEIKSYQKILNEFDINYAVVFDDDINDKNRNSVEKLNKDIMDLCKGKKHWCFSPDLETELEIPSVSSKHKPYTAYTFFKDGKKFDELKEESKNKLVEIMDWIKSE